MMYTISMIPYANMAPFARLGTPEGCRFVPLVPSRSVAALMSGEVDAAAVPVGALPILGDRVATLGAYGIAAEKAVGSVLLFSTHPLTALKRPAAVSLTTQSATSIRLLYLILGYVNGFDAAPYATDDAATAAARLLIGDDAMIRAARGGDAYVFDLASEWDRVHGRPFVFARWVVRVDAPPELKDILTAWLSGLDANDERFVHESAPKEAARIGITTEEMIRYLMGMRRVLGQRELEGQAIFLSEVARHVPKEVFSPAPKTVSIGRDKGRTRVDDAAALRLLTEMPLGELMARAHAARINRHGETTVTYVRDTNPNYTNICTTNCRFCAFCRDSRDPEAYTLTPEALADRVATAEARGATTVLLQGGHNPLVRLADWRAYLRAIRQVSPTIHIHPFSPPEILDMSEKEGCSTRAVLEALREEGIDTLPGGGAEILVDAVREQIAPGKCPAETWLAIMAEAHSLGFRTTATMMFGHQESDRDIVAHLMKLREVQDRTGGFNAFIPWSFKPGRSRLSDTVTAAAHPAKYLRILATARLALDNFNHIQSSWFSESERAGMLGLLAGADDFGGILVEENVLKTSGYERRTTEERVHEMIRQAGFVPALRDSRYRVLSVMEQAKAGKA
jgi:cyclic dehypoxanthinyl futalosine synthase